MKRYLILALFLCGVTALSSTVIGASVRSEHGIYAMPESVVYVQRLGYWRYGSLDGSYRVVVMEDESSFQRHKIYVQWLCQCDRGMIAMRALDELHENERYIFTPPTFRRSSNVDLLEFVARDVRTHEDYQVQVQLTGIGELRVQRQRMPTADRSDTTSQ
ncbi:hypothetical protein NFC81_04770 [Salinispirillum sp. LH 10-3-1]|uniref:Uncharacterized protein n=1 Tax=Salinispirillum sp. LH 10-3-1 TaxID=2952525 RepID=A0AB38YJ68_9GAMM